jgi:hypothetical protein
MSLIPKCAAKINLRNIKPRGKESTEVRITQNKGKESENFYQKLLCVHKHLLSSD